MVLSKRERVIVIAVVAAGVALILDKIVIGPLWDNLSQTSAQKESLQKRVNEATNILDTSRRLGPRWNEMIQTGVKSDPADAEGQVFQAVHNWAGESRVNIQVMSAERLPLLRDAFLGEIAFTVAGSGSMNAVAQLLWRMQYATIPLRITDVKVVSTKDATDNLSATVRLSTLYLPGGKRPTSQPGTASAPAGGGQ
jgi:hypothetical protein